MILPTPEEITAAKVEASKLHGRDEVLLVQLSAPIDAALLFAPLGRAGWASYVDEQLRDAATSHKNLVLTQRLWPSPDEALEVLRHRPAAAKKIAGRLHQRAGQVHGEPSVELLSVAVDRAAAGNVQAKADERIVDVVRGLTLARARDLLSKAAEVPDGGEARELWLVTGPSSRLAVVMATPDADQFLAASAANLRAIEKRERVVETRLDFAVPSVVWSREPIDALLEDQPAISSDLWAAYMQTGGEGAEASCKSL